MNQALEMARVAYQALDEKKGEDIRVIDISGISVIGDYFIITNADKKVYIFLGVWSVKFGVWSCGSLRSGFILMRVVRKCLFSRINLIYRQRFGEHSSPLQY